MAVTAQFLKNIMAQARPIIERQMDDAKLIAGFRDVVSANGGDWGALKALIKAHVEDENDEAGDGKRVQKIRDKADSTSAYADMLGLANMNENNFSASQSYAGAKGRGVVAKIATTETGEITEHEQPETARTEPADAAVTAGNDLREPAAAEQGQIIREGDAPRETDRLGGDVSCPDAEFQSDATPSDAATTPQAPQAVAASHRSMSISPLEPREAGELKGFGFTVKFEDKPLNPDCRKASRGEQCALMHSQALCSKCQQEKDARRVAA